MMYMIAMYLIVMYMIMMYMLMLQPTCKLCLLQALSSEAQQGLQDLKQALRAASLQRHSPQIAAAAQQAPNPPAALAPQPAATANVPEQLASIQNAELRDRAPQYQHIARNAYMRGIQRPKRQARDDIHVCNCRAPQGAFGALPARQPTQRQANSTLHKQMLQKAAAAAAAAAKAAAASNGGGGANAAGGGAAAAPTTAAGGDGGGAVAAGQQPVPLQQADASPASAASPVVHAMPGSTQGVANGADAASPSGLAAATADAGVPGGTPSPVAQAGPAQPLGCGEDCLNRLSFIHCDPKLCPCGEACSNR